MLLLAKNSTLPKLIRNGRLFLGGALLGVLVFVLVFGVSTLDVTNDAFCRGGYIEKDIQQHYAGWLFYRQSSAGWPLCIARGINYPDGLSVAYTDSIPLVAALLKPVANLVGGTFQYMGWFTLVCFALQGGFGALLAGLFLPGCAAPLAADLLFVTSPVLFERVFRHTSLGAQFFVLAALYFYFAARRKGQYASRGLFALNVLAVGIHPYFLPMTYAITLALLLEYALHNRQLAGPGLYLAANFSGTALLGWALGLLYGSAEAGFYLQVLAPVLPLLYLESMVDGAMKGMGEQKAVFRYSLWDAVLRIAGVLLLLPRWGMKGFLWVILLSSAYTCQMNTARLLHVSGLQPRLWRWLGAPALAALVSAGAGEGLRALLAGWLGSGSTPTRLAALCAGGFGMAAVCLAVQWPLGLGEEVRAILRTEKSRRERQKSPENRNCSGHRGEN